MISQNALEVYMYPSQSFPHMCIPLNHRYKDLVAMSQRVLSFC